MTTRPKIYLLFAVVLVLLLAVQLYAAEPYNPHSGLERFFLTPINHKGGTRYLIPQSFWDASRAIEWTNRKSENAERPVISRVIPSLVDPEMPTDPTSWRMLEDQWWQFERLDTRVAAEMESKGRYVARDPVTTYPYRYTWNHSPTVSQWRMLIPKPDGDTYGVIADFGDWPNQIRFAPHMSQINEVTLGSDLLVIGPSRLNIGPGLRFVTGPEPHIQLGRTWVTEKNGKLYLPVRVDGRKYGIRLESME